MSAREAIPSHEAILMDQKLDERALRILTDGKRHAPAVITWAFGRNPYMAQFRSSELILGAHEVYRS